jgi:hypothetical protein
MRVSTFLRSQFEHVTESSGIARMLNNKRRASYCNATSCGLRQAYV